MITSNIKCLITAGCSYSQVPNRDVAWPFHLNKHLKPKEIHYLGQGAAGNGIISRKTLYTVTKALEKYKPEEILVGVIWSGFDRRDIYSRESLDCTRIEYGFNADNYANPVKIIDPKNRNHYIINKHWDDYLTVNFMKYAYTDEDSIMITLEHMLRVQTFLKLHNIKYFMAEYDYDCLGNYNLSLQKDLINDDKELSFLYNQIDKSYWLPINNLYEWAKYESGFDFARPPDPHPSTEQHKAFVDKIVIPYLLDKRIISDIIV
jgi:hypothetical protein